VEQQPKAKPLSYEWRGAAAGAISLHSAAMARNNHRPVLHCMCLDHLREDHSPRETGARRLNPQLTIKWFAEHVGGLPPTNIVDGLRKAGLPEE
jgi:hypothetical protein